MVDDEQERYPTPDIPLGRPSALLAVALCLAGGLLLAGSPSSAAAQDASVRAIATVVPSEGRRSLELMRPLTAPEVAAVQRRLAELGYRPGEPDGALDDAARRALEAFQRQEGLAVCGCVDVATVRRLGLELRVLVTRVAAGDGRSGGGDGAEQEAADVEVLYPTTTRPAPPEPAPPRGAPRPGPPVRGTAPAAVAPAGTGRLWTRTVGTVVPVPVFLGGAGPFPGGHPGVRAPTTEGGRGGLRPKPFGRVPFPGSRPSPPSDGGR